VQKAVLFSAQEVMMKNAPPDLRLLLTSCIEEVTSSQQHPPSLLSGSSGWNVATGAAGLALFYHQMGKLFPEREWRMLTEKHLALTMLMIDAEINKAVLPLGLWTGLTGVCQVVAHLAISSAEYQPLHKQLTRLLFEQTMRQYHSTQTLEEGATFHEYDVISGPAGIGAYALLHRDHPDASVVLDVLLKRFLFLTQPSPHARGHLRFYIPPQRAPHASFLQQMPEGATDLGFAHGIAGGLAFLSLAVLEGFHPPGLLETIARLAHWLLTVRYEDHQGVGWATAVPKGVHAPLRPGRPAWCYGTPGVAWALWLAGRTLGQPSWQQMAITAMESTEHAIFEAQQLPSPILCHGLSGVIFLLEGFLAAGASTPKLLQLRERCVQELVHRLASVQEQKTLLQLRTPTTTAELLEGLPGIGLTLLLLVQKSSGHDPLFPFLLLTTASRLHHVAAPVVAPRAPVCSSELNTPTSKGG
jgi:hypothetical protein